MVTINRHYLELQDSYLFSTIARKVADYRARHPHSEIISLGIGDVTLPLCPAVTEAMQLAAGEMGRADSFRGYGPEQGYDFLREAVSRYYASRDIAVRYSEVFISDGAKSDIANFPDILGDTNRVLIPSPVYPVYLDTNIMAGRKITFLHGTVENGFLPFPDDNTDADIVYLCSPNNPTGSVYTRAGLRVWVDWANAHGALLLFDAAYESFVQDPALPRSIFEIAGARTCAVEFCSLSKTAGFTGTRCGYTVVPEELLVGGVPLHRLWLRRQTTKFNGVSYIVQRGAQAALSPQGQLQSMKAVTSYLDNAKMISEMLDEMGVRHVGGSNAPYVWLHCGGSSWAYFDRLLQEAQVVGTPGLGFGEAGEGFFRLTGFGSRENTKEAVRRMKAMG